MPLSGTLAPARIFKTRYFSRWARRSGLADEAFITAVDEMSAGLVDADLGGGVVKSELENIEEDQLKNLRIYAADLLSLSNEQLGRSLASGNLEEVARECKA